MRRYILAFGYWLLAIGLIAQGLSEQQMIQKMTSAAEEIKVIQCSFTQTKHSKMLAGEQVSQGKMFCRQPDQLRWEYTSPRPSTLILDGTKAQLVKGDADSGSRNRFVGELARMIMNSVAGKCLTDNKAFQVSAKETPTEYIATLFPLKKEMKHLYAELILHFDIKQSTVTQVELHEKNGDRTIIELHDIRIGK